MYINDKNITKKKNYLAGLHIYKIRLVHLQTCDYDSTHTSVQQRLQHVLSLDVHSALVFETVDWSHSFLYNT